MADADSTADQTNPHGPSVTYESPPSYRQQNPLVREASLIADELDHGSANRAMARLQQDLFQLQGYPTQQRNLVEMVEHFDHKGQGADLQMRLIRRNGITDVELTAVRHQNRGGGNYNYGSQNSDNYYAGRQNNGQYSDNYYPSRQNNGQYSDNYYSGRQNNGQYSDNYYSGRQNNGQYSDNYYDRPSNQQSQNPDNRHSYSSNYRNDTGKGHEVARPGSLTPQTMAALEYAEGEARRHGVTIDITSAGRTYEEQARLYRELHGRSPVAVPGTSSHELGVAIDVKNYQQAKPYLLAAGFTHGDGAGPIPGDPWHFRYTG